MPVSIENSNEGCKLAVSGDLLSESLTGDYWLEATKKEQADLKESNALTIDLSGLEKVDTAGLAYIINMIRDLGLNQVTASVINIPEKLMNLAQLSGADVLLKKENNND